MDPRAGRNRSGMIRTPRVRTPDLDRDQGRRADPQISPPPSASIADGCTKLALTSLRSRWWHPLSLDTIPQVGSARATRLPMGRRQLGCGDRFRPTARYSAATTARGVAQPAENRGGIPGYRY